MSIRGRLGKLGFQMLDNLIWVLVLTALVGFALVADPFFTPFNLLNIVPRTAAIGILVIGQSLVLLTRNFDLSSESALSVTAMVGALLMAPVEGGGWGVLAPPWLGIIVMLLAGGLIGLFNGVMVTKLRVNSLLVTAAMLILLRGLVYVMAPGTTVCFPSPIVGWLGKGVLAQIRFGNKLVDIQFSLVFVILAFVVAHVVTRYTQWGRNVYSIGANQEASKAAGIRSDRTIITVYVISGLCSAVAGWILAGRVDCATPRSGTGLVFVVFAAAVIGGISLDGGRGSLIGAMGGFLLWGILDSGLNIMMLSPYAVEVFRGSLLLFAVFLDALKVRYLRRVSIREALAGTKIGLQDTRMA